MSLLCDLTFLLVSLVGRALPSPKYLDVLERNDKHGVYELVRVCETVKEIPKGIKMKKIYPYNCLGK